MLDKLSVYAQLHRKHEEVNLLEDTSDWLGVVVVFFFGLFCFPLFLSSVFALNFMDAASMSI